MTAQKIVIRDEARDDVAVITEVPVAAFETLEISGHTEQFIIEALRAAVWWDIRNTTDAGSQRMLRLCEMFD